MQYLFLQLGKNHFSRVTLQQVVECGKQVFTLASIEAMGSLTAEPTRDKPLDVAVLRLSRSNEVLQYLAPLPQTRASGSGSREQADQPPAKRQRVGPKGSP